MVKIKTTVGKIKACKSIIEVLNFKDEHNKYIVIKNLKAFNILEDVEDDLRFQQIKLAKVDSDGIAMKDEKGNLKFTTDSTIEFEKIIKETSKKEIEIEIYQFRVNKEITELSPLVMSIIDILLPNELLQEPK